MMIHLIMAAAETKATAGGGFDLAHIGQTLRYVASFASIFTGLFFVLGGTIGVLRLPDFFTRLHAAGMTDTLGAELIILGLMIQADGIQMILKLLLVGFILFVTSPTATHAVAGAAHQAGLKPLLGKFRAPHPADIGQKDVGREHR